MMHPSGAQWTQELPQVDEQGCQPHSSAALQPVAHEFMM